MGNGMLAAVVNDSIDWKRDLPAVETKTKCTDEIASAGSVRAALSTIQEFRGTRFGECALGEILKLQIPSNYCNVVLQGWS
jgi:hypothetical protein